MSKKGQSSASGGFMARTARWRPYVLPVLLVTAGLLAVLVALQRLERFLIHDPRFTLRAAGDADEPMPDLVIHGARRASLRRIREVFAPDVGRSAYLIPLQARRDELQGVDWIRSASVSRIWPNRLEVRVREREPVAFARIGGKRSYLMLVDEDGEFLPIPPGSRFQFVVITGLRRDQELPDRRRRVRTVLRLLREAAELGREISEVDATDLDNLRILIWKQDRALDLILGRENFRQRLESFYEYYPDIQRRLPHSATLDLRLEDRITVVERDGYER